MQNWRPELIKELELSSLNLLCIHVAVFENLERLNVQNNKISNLLGSGMAQCVKLTHVDLSSNQIQQKETLKEFRYSFLPSNIRHTA